MSNPFKFSSMIKFGSRPDTNRVFYLDYFPPNGIFSDVIDFTPSEHGVKRLSVLKNKEKMEIGTTQITQDTSSSVSVDWSNGNNFSYAIVTWPGGSAILPSSRRSFVIPGLSMADSHLVSVRPVSGLSIGDNPLATPVATVTAGNLTTTGATVTWSGGTYAYVKVSWTGDDSGGMSGNITRGTTSYAATGLASGGSYVFTVTAYNSAGVATTGVETAVNPLATPVATVTAGNPTTTGATVTWSGGTYAYVKVSWTGDYSGMSGNITRGTTSYAATGLVSGGSYVFAVTAYNSAGVATTGVESAVVWTATAYDFTSFTFTNAGETGAYGPSLSMIRSAYNIASGGGAWTQSSSNLNMATSGVQMWTVPKSGSYQIKVAGASGGTNYVGSSSGYIVTGRKTLTAGTVLHIVVGQMGTQSGGGGASWVFLDSVSSQTLIVVAGGGGGPGFYAYNGPGDAIGCSAKSATGSGNADSGRASNTKAGGSGGSNGAPGAGGAGASTGSSGGAGVGGSRSAANTNNAGGCGGAGSVGITSSTTFVGGQGFYQGGFGGGGGAAGSTVGTAGGYGVGGGGGGGYNGGGGGAGGADTNWWGGGGGGGSSLLTGLTNVTTAARTGHGYVQIVML